MKKSPLSGILKLLFIGAVISNAATALGQVQKGNDILGAQASDGCGFSVSMPDANTMVVGSPFSYGSSFQSGNVRVFAWNGTAWVQKGLTLDGGSSSKRFGFSVSMPDANTFAVGEPSYSVNGTAAGRVKVYSWDGTNWAQKGTDLNGEAASDFFGTVVDMPNASTVAIGAPGNSGNGSGAGHVRVFSWNGTAWVQIGADLDGESAADGSGTSLSMPDPSTIAIGAVYNDAGGQDAGHVRVFQWNGNSWVQKGLDIDGFKMFQNIGFSVSMPNASTVAVASADTDSSQVIVYNWDGSTWKQRGSKLFGTLADPNTAARMVSMPDANTIAMGSYWEGDKYGNAGRVRIYKWNGSEWGQVGSDIFGDSMNDYAGRGICMPDAKTVAVGIYGSNKAAKDAGLVRVYSLDNLSKVESSLATGLRVFPNPTKGSVVVDLGAETKAVSVVVTNIAGQVVLEKYIEQSAYLDIEIPGEAGLYIFKIAADDQQASVRVVKN